jgi:hypothetical protein
MNILSMKEIAAWEGRRRSDYAGFGADLSPTSVQESPP